MEHQVANDPRRTGVFAVRVAERATVDFVDSVALPDKGFSWSVEELRGDASMRIFDAHVVRAWLVDSTSPECARPSEHVPTGQHLAWLTDSGWRPAASGGYAEQCPVGAVRVQNDASDVFSSVDSSIGLGTPQLGTFVVAVGAGDPMPACPTPLGCIQFIDRTMGRILGRLDPIELPGPVAASADASRSPAIAPTSSLPFAPTQPPSQVTSIWSPVTLPAVPGQSTVSGTTGGGRDRGERRPAGYSPVPMHRKTA
jgi:hypothetical protein